MKKSGRAFWVACYCISGLNANPHNFKGTYDILKDEHKDLSIIHGAVAWETRTIQHMYDHGALGYRGDRIPSETITLVHKFFHRPPGTQGEAGFLVTRPVRELSHTKVAEFTASMLVFLKELQQKKVFNEYLKKDALLKQYQSHYKAHQQAPATKAGKVVLDKAGKKLEKEVADVRRLVLTSFDTADNHPQYESPLKELAHYPIKAFLECARHDYLPLTMPYIILQAMLYKKVEGDRTALSTYYTYLHEHLDCLAYAVSATWPSDVFSYEQRQFLLEACKKEPVADDLLRHCYENYAFLKLSPTEYPPLISYGDATIKDAVFPDCMDTTLRNCFNFLAYNPRRGKFDVGLLEQRLGTTVHASVKNFYELHADPATAADKKVHSDWASMVSSNIPHVVYCRSLPRIDHGTKKCLTIPQPTDVTAAFLAHNDCRALPESSTVYDMFPSLKNFIIASDYLLGLQVCAHAPSGEWAKEGFVRAYLPKVLAALKVQVPVTLDYEMLDQKDGTISSLFVPLSFSGAEAKPYAFNLNLHIEHSAAYSEGEMLLNNQAQTLSEDCLQQRCTETSPASLLFLEARTALPQDITSERLLAWLFAQDLDDYSKLFSTIDKLHIFDENVVDIMLYCAQKHKEPIAQDVLACRIYQAALQRGLSEHERVVTMAVTTAGEKIRSKNMFVRGEALQLFKTLLSKDKGVEYAINCAKELVDTGDRKSVSAALALYAILAGQGKALDKAFDAAQKGMLFNGEQPAGIHFEARQLLKCL